MNEIKNNFLQEMAISSEKRLEESRIHLSEESLLGACEDLEERSAIEFQEGFIFITEIKKSSPSLGEISNREFDITDQAGIYVKSGTNVISVLTEPLRFSGSLQDLKHVSKAFPETPTMRKDFLVDPYQVSEAFINGARGILLIVAMLSDDMLNQMVERAIKHQMFVLLEVFDEKDMQRMQMILSKFKANRKNILLGVNCRDLRTLDVSFSRFEELSSLIPKDQICIAESGITKASEIKTVSKLGYKGALIGTALMKSEYPRRLLSEMRLATLKDK